MRYHFAPPLWVGPDKVTGVPLKRSYGAWVGRCCGCSRRCVAFAARLIDPFGHTHERRTERELITDYEQLVAEIERVLRPDNLAARRGARQPSRDDARLRPC